MDLFGLPNSTKVNKVIPKNAFDEHTTTKQKKLFTDLISKITWAYKIAPETINLEASEIKEIQVFRVELKEKTDIQVLLNIIDKAIPYTIVFVVDYGGMLYISTTVKHPHPIQADTSVIDWTFRTKWFSSNENDYTFKLKKNIDSVYHDFCIRLSGHTSFATRTLEDLIAFEKQIDALRKEIARLKAGKASAKQFNLKVELNLELQTAEKQLRELIKCS